MNSDKLYDVAVGALARRDYSKQQLELFLKSHSSDSNQISTIIKRLEDHNYLNDNRLIENELNKYLVKQYGQARIRQELKRKGFDDTDINCTLESLDIDWRAIARELKEKKFGNSKAVDAKSKAKQIRYLQYKGHAISDIMSVLE